MKTNIKLHRDHGSQTSSQACAVVSTPRTHVPTQLKPWLLRPHHPCLLQPLLLPHLLLEQRLLQYQWRKRRNLWYHLVDTNLHHHPRTLGHPQWVLHRLPKLCFWQLHDGLGTRPHRHLPSRRAAHLLLSCGVSRRFHILDPGSHALGVLPHPLLCPHYLLYCPLLLLAHHHDVRRQYIPPNIFIPELRNKTLIQTLHLILCHPHPGSRILSDRNSSHVW